MASDRPTASTNATCTNAASAPTSSTHLAIEDASGDSAIIDYINGKQIVQHGSQFRIMTNDPKDDQQIALRPVYQQS